MKIQSDNGFGSGTPMESASNAESSQEEGTFRSAKALNEENGNSYDNSSINQTSVAMKHNSSAFDFESSIRDVALNINKYIPVGCIYIRNTNCNIPSEDWAACKAQWHALRHVKDTDTTNTRYLPADLQELILQELDMLPTVALHDAAWIKMELGSCDAERGIARVYVLPDDIARVEVDRSSFSLRKALINLLDALDHSKPAWDGFWLERGQTGTSLPTPDPEVESPSLLQLFNTLPSPDPQPEAVQDFYIQDAMYRILDNKVEGLSTPLYTYQQRSAALMIQREVVPAQLVDPRLSVVKDQHGKQYYCDASTGTVLHEPKFYEAARGGICAETMGLGKTIIYLAVILASKEVSSKIPGEVLGQLPIRKRTGSLMQMAASNIGQHSLPWRHWLKGMESDGSEYRNIRTALGRVREHYLLEPPVPRRVSRNPMARMSRKIYLSTTTIVVVPSNLIQQWLKEIEKHTINGSLSLLLMNDGKDCLPAVEKLLEYDIILFSRPRFEYEARDERLSDKFTKGNRYKTNVSQYQGDRYHSPLKDIHFKRLIVDEGHTFGNASKSSKSEAVAVVDFLNISARWIISGTPTQGLYGLEIVPEKSPESSTPKAKRSETSGVSIQAENSNSQGQVKNFLRVSKQVAYSKILETQSSSQPSGLRSIPIRPLNESQKAKVYAQERKDLEKLGNIATSFLKVRPWSNSQGDNDSASWASYVMQPQHDPKARGSLNCLRTTLEGMIIRHRPEDVIKDVELPPFHHKFVYLEGSLQNKLSLNTFFLMIITNAVTSERKDLDYFFDDRQKKNLNQLVSNLRQASFFWSGFEIDHIRSTVSYAKTFLEEKKIPVTREDEILLLEAISIGELVIENRIAQLISQTHEIPFYINNEWEEEVREAWSLDGDDKTPTLMGATLVHNAQKFVEAQAHKEDFTRGLVASGTKSMLAAFDTQNTQPASTRVQPRRGKTLKRPRPSDAVPELAGGVAVGDGSSPRKKSRASITASRQSKVRSDMLLEVTTSSSLDVEHSSQETSEFSIPIRSPVKSALKQTMITSDLEGVLDPDSSLASATIVSTASTKLSYLMSRISLYHEAEKILVFYESDNVAYYIAQALECLGIKHLIYAKSLHSARRAKYVVTFNTTDTFRVLLMDVSQAAFGLDLSSASRVFFVNPVFSPQVEAQAVKRAHRIGQIRPVFVETLVLKDSIEEVILERRKDMSEAEHQKCTSILDDQTVYDWIKNVRFIDIPSKSPPGPQQMARLERPLLLFRNVGSNIVAEKGADPDEGLVGGMGMGVGVAQASEKNKGKKRARVTFLDNDEVVGDL